MIMWRWTSELDGLNGAGRVSFGVGAGGLEDGSGYGASKATWYLDVEDHIACDPFKVEQSLR